MKKGKYIDPFLEKRLVKYDEWLNKGQISYSSKVIPISGAFSVPASSKMKIWNTMLKNVLVVDFA